jgi:acyl-coenzyme A synthetase/AMP-(fatty) acid ligase
MSTSPLLAAESLSAPLIVRRDRKISAAEFVGAVDILLARLPRARHIINLCERRYFFLLGLVAACLREQLTLLPPDQSAGALRQLKEQYSDSVVVNDATIASCLSGAEKKAEMLPNWRIDDDRVIAVAFTSGSTGVPQAHPKTWRTLSRNSQLAAAEILGGSHTHLVATVPAQHVYGLETTAIAVLAANCSVFDEKPFFAGDVRAALEAVDEPRTLVTTPTHLRNLLAAKIALPSLQRVVSATAALSPELAEQIEIAWTTQVFEIYGCTEAGVMAKRRTVEQKPWKTFTSGRMMLRGDVAHYEAPQLPHAVPLQDILDLLSPTDFTLLGRSADMVKVAGKRTSLQALTLQLLSIDGVQDAVVFIPTADARPAALVVARNKTAAGIATALGERVDAVFLPRPLILLDQLPRTSVGKLPREELLRVLKHHMDTSG